MHVSKNLNIRKMPQKAKKPIKSFVLFNISEEGKVSNVRVKSSNEKLRIELIRVVKLLPDFIPGKVGDKNVEVKYTLTITYSRKK